MTIKFILNPEAFQGKAEKVFWPRIEKYFNDRAIPFEMEKTSKAGHAASISKRAVETGFKTIVSVGGDGTAHDVLNGIVGTEAAMGIIPCGVGNDFVKMLGLSINNLEAACQVVADGYTKKIDIGMVNGKYFLNMVGIGFDGEVAERKAKTPKYIHGFYAYLIQIFPVLFFYQPKHVKIRMNGVSLEADILLLTIGNGRYSGGGFKLTPQAELDDGLLDICLSKYPGRLTVLRSISKVPKGEHVNLSFATMFRATEISVVSETPLAAHVDGEVVREKEYNIQLLPKVLNLLVKKTDKGAIQR